MQTHMEIEYSRQENNLYKSNELLSFDTAWAHFSKLYCDFFK